MFAKSVSIRTLCAVLPFVAGITVALPVAAARIEVQKGADIVLDFDTGMSDKTAHDGDKVRLHVDQDLIENGATIIRAGTPVEARITAVKKRERFGVNARIQLKVRPIAAVDGTLIHVGYKTRSADNEKTAGAAAASAGGAIVLGPIGLVGGYFIVGKHVNVKPGDKFTVSVDEDATVHVH